MSALLVIVSPGRAVGRPAAPLALGRVFEAHRSALLRVRAEKEGFPWVDGVLVGTRGEFVFGAPMAPAPILRVVGVTGGRRRARLLGYDRARAVAVGRLEGGMGRSLSVVRVSSAVRPAPGAWLLVLSHDRRGRARPHAGQFSAVPYGSDGSAGLAGSAHVAAVDAPARPGSPVLSPAGELVGLALDRHRRRTRVLLNAAFVPFVVEVVRRAGP